MPSSRPTEWTSRGRPLADPRDIIRITRPVPAAPDPIAEFAQALEGVERKPGLQELTLTPRAGT